MLFPCGVLNFMYFVLVHIPHLQSMSLAMESISMPNHGVSPIVINVQYDESTYSDG